MLLLTSITSLLISHLTSNSLAAPIPHTALASGQIRIAQGVGLQFVPLNKLKDSLTGFAPNLHQSRQWEMARSWFSGHLIVSVPQLKQRLSVSQIVKGARMWVVSSCIIVKETRQTLRGGLRGRGREEVARCWGWDRRGRQLLAQE